MTDTVALVLAQPAGPANDPGGQGEDFGKSSPVGLVLLIVFAIAIVFLVRSMSKHVKKLPSTFDESKAAAAAPARVKRAEAKAAAEAEAAAAADEPDGEESAGSEDRAESGKSG
ncbi:hypothetical protein GCM10009854_03750 [Saccharopolyspora halophila]|uniref:Sec-independent protein translocase protein TatA n=1 Tax=Saccharopolyspora halophila TaxID=405551 RepID=A0ABP5SIE3_9PSEU